MEELGTPPPNGPYAMSAEWDDGSYDVASSFCKATYPVQIFVGLLSSVMLTFVSLVDMGGGPNLLNMETLPPKWRESMKNIKYLQVRTAMREVVSVD